MAAQPAESSARDAVTPERRQQIEAIFHEAAGRPDPELTEYLNRDRPPDLRADVDAMLAADRLPDAGWDDAAGAAAEAFASGNVPRRAGAYELVRNLGKGGMGTVFLGRRADGEYEQTVAIRFLRSDFRNSIVAGTLPIKELSESLTRLRR